MPYRTYFSAPSSSSTCKTFFHVAIVVVIALPFSTGCVDRAAVVVATAISAIIWALLLVLRKTRNGGGTSQAAAESVNERT
jgi:hypothetical protein